MSVREDEGIVLTRCTTQALHDHALVCVYGLDADPGRKRTDGMGQNETGILYG